MLDWFVALLAKLFSKVVFAGLPVVVAVALLIAILMIWLIVLKRRRTARQTDRSQSDQ
jgi:Flp pilus assembly protein TadB